VAEIINLRQARKATARVEKDAKAARNRAHFGRSRSERQREAMERALARKNLDGQRRDPEGEP
jgi:hypothetical protein